MPVERCLTAEDAADLKVIVDLYTKLQLKYAQTTLELESAVDQVAAIRGRSSTVRADLLQTERDLRGFSSILMQTYDISQDDAWALDVEQGKFVRQS